jgi:hypothetical protein
MELASTPDSGMLAQPPAPLREVRYVVSREFVPLLAQAGVSLLVSTYQAGKLVVVGTEEGRLALGFYNFEQPMGLALSGEMLAVGTRNQVWLLAREAGMAGQLDRGRAYDDCYLARRSHFTGQIHIHELAWGVREGEVPAEPVYPRENSAQQELRPPEPPRPHPSPLPEGEGNGELWIVNTLFSCLCTLDERHSFVPRWRPPFISALAAEDRCHLNGLALERGQPRFVTAMSETDGPQSWRPTKVYSGCVLDVASGETSCGAAWP